MSGLTHRRIREQESLVLTIIWRKKIIKDPIFEYNTRWFGGKNCKIMKENLYLSEFD